MNIIETIQTIRENQLDSIIDINHIRERRVVINVIPEKLIEMARYLFKDLECRFIIASALQTKSGLEIYYHFSKDIIGLIINIKVLIPCDNAEIESLTDLFIGANWIEREIHELYGIKFLNHPNLEKLISEGNWSKDYYPYRKENKDKPLP